MLISESGSMAVETALHHARRIGFTSPMNGIDPGPYLVDETERSSLTLEDIGKEISRIIVVRFLDGLITIRLRGKITSTTKIDWAASVDSFTNYDPLIRAYGGEPMAF